MINSYSHLDYKYIILTYFWMYSYMFNFLFVIIPKLIES